MEKPPFINDTALVISRVPLNFVSEAIHGESQPENLTATESQLPSSGLFGQVTSSVDQESNPRQLGSDVKALLETEPHWRELMQPIGGANEGIDILLSLLEGNHRSPRHRRVTAMTISESKNLFKESEHVVWGGELSLRKPKEIQSWQSSALLFSQSSNINVGLLQFHSGPCGVLAPLQSLIFVYFYLSAMACSASRHPCVIDESSSILKLPLSTRLRALAWAMTFCLYRSTSVKRYILPHDLSTATQAEGLHLNLATKGDLPAGEPRLLEFEHIEDVFDTLVEHLKEGANDMLPFVMSLVMTRTPNKIKEDMDDPATPLIGQFGHSNQELVNLLLNGQATSNVFNGEQTLGDGLHSCRLRGIPRRGVVGFLTELEPLRYCEVGSHLKSPLFPFWVIGSASHYTCLVSLTPAVAAISSEVKFENTIGGAFDCFDSDKNGFILADKLTGLLHLTGLKQYFKEARAKLDPPGQGGIILKFDFLQWARTIIDSETQDDHKLVEPPKKFNLYLYDGQKCPGPKWVQLKLEQIDFEGVAPDDNALGLGRILRTKWTNALATIISFIDAS